MKFKVGQDVFVKMTIVKCEGKSYGLSKDKTYEDSFAVIYFNEDEIKQHEQR